MLLGSNTDASFLEEADGVTVSMTRGNMSLYHPEASKGFRVKIGDVTVLPAKGYRTMGEVAMLNGLLQVTAKDGALQVEQSGKTKEVSKGKTITISTTADRAPTPVPPGKLHIKHILNHKGLIYLGAGAILVGTTVAIVEITTRGPAASIVKPTP